MTFQNTADLAADENYQARLAACVFTDALGRTGDALADKILSQPPFYATSVFAAPVASSPGFGEKYATGGQETVTDGDLLSAVQASWDRLSALYVTP